MPYLVDTKDINFNLWEFLKADQLLQFDAFKDQGQDMYQMVIDQALKVAMQELDPLYTSGDREECFIKDGVVITPKGFKKAYKTVAENGFIGIDVPTDCGGQGLPFLLGLVAHEFFIGANISIEMYCGLTRGSSHLIYSFGTEELTKLFCPKMYDGTWAGTMCLTEPQAGSALGDITTKAVKNDDGTFNITGNKIFISGGDQDITENIIHLVLARVEGDQPGTKGITLFAVPKIWVNPDGSLGEANDVNCVNVEHKLGIKGQATCSLNFGEDGKCRGWLIGEQSKGMKYMFQLMNEARVMTGLQGAAISASAYLNAVKYAKDRTQGGNTPIIEYPDIRRNLALCKAWTEGMRSILYKAALNLDISVHHPDEAVRKKTKNRLNLLTPICKAYSSDFGFKVCEIAMQVYGGAGYIKEYPVEQYLRDTKIASIYEGTNGIQALDLIGRKLPKNNGELLREFYEDITAFTTKLESNDDLKEEGTALKSAADTMGQVAMQLGQWGMEGDFVKPQLGATPFLEICGHVLVAYSLLEQATVAQDKIKEGSSDPFYTNKIKTAQFFANEVLPLVKARAKTILKGSPLAMEIEY